MFNDDPFSLDWDMDNIHYENKNINKQLSNTEQKYEKIKSGQNEKIHHYPLLHATLNDYRKDDIRLSKDKLRKKIIPRIVQN